MEAQNVDPNWANQTEVELFRLLYTTPSGEESNIQDQANFSDYVALPHVDHTHNI